MADQDYGDFENPRTFEQALETLKSQFIDYEVAVGGHQGALMTRETWLEAVADKSFVDYDGHGNELDDQGNVLGTVDAVWEGEPRKSKLVSVGNPGWIKPSEAARIRPETKYILWYNR